MAALIVWLTALSAVAASCTAGLWIVLRRERAAWAMRTQHQARRIRDLARELAQARTATCDAPALLTADERQAWDDIVAQLRAEADTRRETS